MPLQCLQKNHHLENLAAQHTLNPPHIAIPSPTEPARSGDIPVPSHFTAFCARRDYKAPIPGTVILPNKSDPIDLQTVRKQTPPVNFSCFLTSPAEPTLSICLSRWPLQDPIEVSDQLMEKSHAFKVSTGANTLVDAMNTTHVLFLKACREEAIHVL